jgi:ribosome biogenesis protein ENP2
MGHLVGTTNLLRPYMHGYFVASKLYEQARLIANPYIWEEERTKRIKEKVEKERASRIRGSKKSVKVNQKLVDKMLARQQRREKVDEKAGVLGDDRFGKLFEDEEFVVDETSREFKMLNPSTKVESAAGEARPRGTKDNSSDESESEDEIRAEPKPKPEMRISSSSYKKSGHQKKDVSLGSRVNKSSGKIERRGRTDVVGERQITFAPTNKKKEKEAAPVEKKGRRDEGRRSASNNVFRGM